MEIETSLLDLLQFGGEHIFEELVRSYQRSRTRGQPDLNWPTIVGKVIEKEKWSFLPAILELGGNLPDDSNLRAGMLAKIFSQSRMQLVESLMSKRCTKHDWITLLPEALAHTQSKSFVPLLEKFVPTSLEEFNLRGDVLEKCSHTEQSLSKLINLYSSLLLKILASRIRLHLEDLQESITVVTRGKEDVIKAVVESYQRQEFAYSLESKWPMLISLACDSDKLFLVPALVDCGASIPDDPNLKFQLASQIDPVKNGALVHQLLSNCEPSQWMQLLHQALHSKRTAMVSVLQECAPGELCHHELRSDILQRVDTHGQVEALSLADKILHSSGLLACLVRKGIKLCKADVAEAVSSFTPGQMLALKEVILSYIANDSVSQTALFWSEMLRKVIDAKNTSIVPFLFAECEASVPDDAAVKLDLVLNLDVGVAESLILQIIGKCSTLEKTTLLESALCQAKDSLLSLLQNSLSILPQKFDLGRYISLLAHRVELLEKLLDCGVSVEGFSSLSPLSVVMNSPDLLSKTKVSVGCILLNRGASIGNAFSTCEPELVVSVITSLLSNSRALAEQIAKEAREQVRVCMVEKGLLTKDVQLLTLAIESGSIDGKPVSLVNHCEFLSRNPRILTILVNVGCSPPSLSAMLEQKTPDRMEMACFLVSHGADIQQLQKDEDSPVHIATKVAIETGKS